MSTITTAVIRFVPLSVCFLLGCGGSGLEGKWRGTVGEMTVEANIETDLGKAVQGVLTLGNPRCFNNGQLSGSIANTSVSLGASGSGSASQTTVVQITGERSGDTITGFFSMTGAGSECTVPRTEITLRR